LKIEEDNEA
jgi:hypothetical protein